MATNIQGLNLTGFGTWEAEEKQQYQEIYERNRHHVYSLCFWMTDNEMAAEEVMGNVFRRAFSLHRTPSPEAIDRALIAELRQITPLGVLTLAAPPASDVMEVRLNEVRLNQAGTGKERHNTMRVYLENAVVQLPPTERMIFLLHDVEQYDHARIAHLLGVDIRESEYGLHQARLRMRQLVSAMQNEVKTQN